MGLTPHARRDRHGLYPSLLLRLAQDLLPARLDAALQVGPPAAACSRGFLLGGAGGRRRPGRAGRRRLLALLPAALPLLPAALPWRQPGFPVARARRRALRR